MFPVGTEEIQKMEGRAQIEYLKEWKEKENDKQPYI